MSPKIIDALNQSPYYYFFLVVDESLDISIPKLQHFTSIRSFDYLHEKNSGKLLSNPKVIDFITKTAASYHKIPAIVPFKPSAKIEFICRKNHWLNVSNNSKLNRLIEDKLKFSSICYCNKIPIVPFVIDKFNLVSYQNAQEKFGPDLIVQTHFGWAGKSTFGGNSFHDFEDKIPPNSIVKFSPYIKNSYTLINNCCLTKDGLIQSPPAIQFTGVKLLTNNPFSTVGRQWPSTAPTNILEQILKITNKFSEYLQKKDYKGFFGLDFLVTKDQAYLLECNPRLTASFAFYTKIEFDAGLTPLFLFHLKEFSQIKYPFDIKKEQLRFFDQKIIGTQLTRRDSNGKINGKLETKKAIVNSPQNFKIDDEIIQKIR